MKDMFYKYDNDYKIEPVKPLYIKQPNELDTCSAVEILYNVKGERLGVKANKNSTFSLYFNIFNAIHMSKDSYEELHKLLETYTFVATVFDFKRDIVETIETSLDEHENYVKVTLTSSDEGPLKSGTYRIRLDMGIPGSLAPLFNEEDAIICIE